MITEFRLPNLTAKDPPGQIKQLHGFLRQTIEQLNWAMQAMNTGNVEVVNNRGQAGSGRPQVAPTNANDSTAAASNFDTIKKLIIKSADIVEAYYTKIDNLLSTSGKYVAQSEYGTYTSNVNQRISANESSISQQINRTESIEKAIKEQKNYIQYGEVGTTLDDSRLQTANAVGIEIGAFARLTDDSGATSNQRFARFTAFGLELFGPTKDAPIATFSGDKMKITDAEVVNLEITGALRMGGYLIDRSNGLAFKWVEGS